MNAPPQAIPNYFETGIFTVPEAASLVGASLSKVRGWLEGHPKSGAGPLIENDLGWLDDRLACSFPNLMELRFIALFSEAGVKIRKIRSVMDEVRKTIDHPHPFATNIVFRTDGRKILAEIGRRNGIKNIFDLHSKNYEMLDVVVESLKDDVIFDPSGDAEAWKPRKKIAPNVIVHPRFSFGQPVLSDSKIPTRVLADAIEAEGSARAVAAWFEVSERRVREAAVFEDSLKRAA